jgi:3-deoxy-D-manno-octulosonic acid kinase
MLSRLRALDLPVPAPLLAGWWRQGATYRAAILVERIPGTRALAGWLGEGVGDAPWEAVGRTIAAFHRHGVDHADLNAHNILVDASARVWLIDLDRGRRRPPAESWRNGNLDRLERSLAKLSPGDEGWRNGFARMLAAYEGALAGDGT